MPSPSRAGSLPRRARAFAAFLAGLSFSVALSAQVLDRRAVLERESFWDNRDFDWYLEQIPILDCPDADIQTTYYYRWELVTKHQTYGSPRTGYVYTEFIDRPFWSGAYGAIVCPAGHQIDELRWLRDARFAWDYARYWFRTEGAQPHRYSSWLIDAIWGLHRVHPSEETLIDLLPDLIEYWETWEERHFVSDVGLFWQTGHDDGMEININSRQTSDTVRGAPAYRPTLNAYLWADALAIARVARLAGKPGIAMRFEDKAARLKENLESKLWDPAREFFFPMAMRDEEKDGHIVEAGSLTYQTGRFAGDEHGRELIGYVPWMFHMPSTGFESAWKFLMDPERFHAKFGPTVTERHDPLFLISDRCCVWSGQSWPYATAQTLRALANVLRDGRRSPAGARLPVSRADYFDLLGVYARTHRKGGAPYIAEAAHPDTGSWEGHDAYNHSEHYFHSSFNDLVISGLLGVVAGDGDELVIEPLVPREWSWFALENLRFRGHDLALVYDRDGTRYGKGKGARILLDGEPVAASVGFGRHALRVPAGEATPIERHEVNVAVNNDGAYFPRAFASHAGEGGALGKIHDGNIWYHVSPPNRWVAGPAAETSVHCGVDLGVPRRVHTVKLYLVDAGDAVALPASFRLESWDGARWSPVEPSSVEPKRPAARRANVVRFAEREVTKLRVVFQHEGEGRVGVSELELWGPASQPLEAAPPPAGNLALNAKGDGHPRATASWTSRYDRVEEANDGRLSLAPTPRNRWTAYESKNETDWLEIDFGEEKKVARVVLYIYDDRGGVQAPQSYSVEVWKDDDWREVEEPKRTPESPRGGVENTVRFRPVTTGKLRVVFRHRGSARSGVSEIEVWEPGD